VVPSIYVANSAVAGIFQQGAFLYIAFVSLFFPGIHPGEFFPCRSDVRDIASVLSAPDQLDKPLVRVLDAGLFCGRLGY